MHPKLQFSTEIYNRLIATVNCNFIAHTWAISFEEKKKKLFFDVLGG